MSLVETIVVGASAIGSFLAAAWAHELTHVTAVGALGGRVTHLDLRKQVVDWEMPADTPRWQLRLIGLAPTGVSIVLLALYVGLHGLPGDIGEWVAVIALALYGFGSAEDYSLSAALENGAEDAA